MKPPPRRRWGLRLAVLFLVLLGAAALAAPWLPLADPGEMDFGQRLVAPQWTQAPVLGTDSKGRDLLARTLWGARISLLVGLLGSAVALAVGLPYGAWAGLKGGRVDRLLMRLADLLEGLPLVVVVLFLLSILQEYRGELEAVGIGRIQVFFVAVGCLFWLPTARVARAEALKLRAAAFVEAARTSGAGNPRLLRRHFLPNLVPAALVMLTLTVPRVVLMEAFLSFLGLGVDPPAVSWGLLASEGLAALNPLVDSAWLLGVPATALALTLLSLNVIGDHLRDAA